MKSLVKMTLIGSAIIFALTGCDDKSEQTTTAQAVAQLQTDAQKEAYAMGSSFSSYMKSTLDAQQITLDPDYVVKGFSETYNDQGQLSQEEIQTILTNFGQRIQEEAKARIEKESADSIAAGDKYREEFAAEAGVKQTESGLLYQILDEGSEQHATANDTVIVHYKGTLVDGREFDSSYNRGEPAVFPLSGVIKGWTEGIQLVGVGGKIKLVVPPELAYGEQSIPSNGDQVGIPAQSTLVFEVELLGIDGDDNADFDTQAIEEAQ